MTKNELKKHMVTQCVDIISSGESIELTEKSSQVISPNSCIIAQTTSLVQISSSLSHEGCDRRVKWKFAQREDFTEVVDETAAEKVRRWYAEAKERSERQKIEEEIEKQQNLLIDIRRPVYSGIPIQW